MREKTYYTTDEITNNLFTTGSILMTESGKEYIGMYHKYTTGEIYSDAAWNPQTSIKLLPYQDITSEKYKYTQLKNVNVKYESFIPYQLKLNINDIQDGYVIRYFIKRINDIHITEIDFSTFTKWQNRKIDPLMYTAIFINWKITGNINDVVLENQRQIDIAKQTISGIDNVITDLTEYYTDNTYIKSNDINGLDS